MALVTVFLWPQPSMPLKKKQRIEYLDPLRAVVLCKLELKETKLSILLKWKSCVKKAVGERGNWEQLVPIVMVHPGKWREEGSHYGRVLGVARSFRKQANFDTSFFGMMPLDTYTSYTICSAVLTVPLFGPLKQDDSTSGGVIFPHDL